MPTHAHDRGIWAKLDAAALGKVGMPFGETFWSPGYAGFTDRFGIPWMISTTPGKDWRPKQP